MSKKKRITNSKASPAVQRPLQGYEYPQPKEELFLCLEGNGKEVEKSFHRYIKSGRGICFTRGSKYDAEDVFGCKKTVYTTPEEGTISVLVQDGEISAEVLIQPCDWYLKAYRVGDKVYELEPDEDGKLFIKGATVLSFGCSYKGICFEGNPGTIRIGLKALKDALRDLVESNGKPDPGSIATLVLYLCEAVKIVEVHEALRRSLLTDEYSRLIDAGKELPIVVRKWSKLSRNALKHRHQVMTKKTPEPLRFVNEIPWSQSPLEILERIRVLYIHALRKTELDHEPKCSRKRWTPPSQNDGPKRGMFTTAITVNNSSLELPSIIVKSPLKLAYPLYSTGKSIYCGQTVWEQMVQEWLAKKAESNLRNSSIIVKSPLKLAYPLYSTGKSIYCGQTVWEQMVQEWLAKKEESNLRNSPVPFMRARNLFVPSQISIRNQNPSLPFLLSMRAIPSGDRQPKVISCATPTGDPNKVLTRTGNTFNRTYSIGSEPEHGAFEAQLKLARLISIPAMMLQR